MLRWMTGVTKLDRIRNERIRGTTKVGEISKKVQERRLKCRHVLRRRIVWAAVFTFNPYLLISINELMI